MIRNVQYHPQTTVREFFFVPICWLSDVTARKDVQTVRMTRCVASAVVPAQWLTNITAADSRIT